MRIVMGLGWCLIAGGVVTALVLDKQALGAMLVACGGVVVAATPVAVGMHTAFFGVDEDDEDDTTPGT